MLTQPLCGSDNVISVSSPSDFSLAVEGDDVSERQSGVFSPLSTPRPCAFSFPPSHTPSNSDTPVPPTIHLNPPLPPYSASLSTPLIIIPQTSSTLPLSSSTLPSSVSSTFSLPPFSATVSPAAASSISSPPAPHLPVICSTSPSASVSAPFHHLSPPPLPPSCCPCSSILPRLLSAHRMEVRRLLRGAMSSLGRRLDSLERKSNRKKRRIRQPREDPAVFTFSCSPPLDSSSSSPSSFSTPLSLARGDSDAVISKSKQSKCKRGEGKVTLRKKSRNTCRVKCEEEEGTGRFVGQMGVSFTGQREDTEGKSLLTLHDFSHREDQGESSQSDKAVRLVKQNNYSSTSHHPLPRLQSAQSDWTSTQSEAACVPFVKWGFSSSTPFTSLFSSHTFSHQQLCSFSVSPTPLLLLSSVAMETVSKLLRTGACGNPMWPLKDWTAPPSLRSDHCYVQSLTPSLTNSGVKDPQKQLAKYMGQSIPLPQGWPPPLPPCSANGLCTPLPASQSAAESKFLSTNAKRSKRVSQIRIRRATPRETQLTPMGLPKIRRLKKKEFSLEEIYTNKNYKSPTANRSLETIFEEPREKGGAPLLIGQQKRRRLLLFPDFTQPRKRKKPQGPGFSVTGVPRKRAARRQCHGDNSCDDNVDLDVMLVERLSALEDFLTQQGLDL